MTPRKAAGDEHASSSRNGRQPNAKSTSTGSAGMMGLVRAAAAVRRSKKDGLARRSGETRGEYGPGSRVSAGSKGFLSVVGGQLLCVASMGWAVGSWQVTCGLSAAAGMTRMGWAVGFWQCNVVCLAAACMASMGWAVGFSKVAEVCGGFMLPGLYFCTGIACCACCGIMPGRFPDRRCLSHPGDKVHTAVLGLDTFSCRWATPQPLVNVNPMDG